MANKQHTFNQLIAALGEIGAVKANTAEAVKKIMADDVHSSEYNYAAALKLKEAAMKSLESIRGEIDELLPQLAAEIDADRARLDLTDPRLQAAVALISAGGGADMGMDAQVSIVEPFANNRETLSALMPLLKKANMHYAAQKAEESMNQLTKASDFADTLGDAVYYASLSLDAPWNVEGVYADALNYAQLNGLTMPGKE